MVVMMIMMMVVVVVVIVVVVVMMMMIYTLWLIIKIEVENLRMNEIKLKEEFQTVCIL
jgi:hypothetical protein